MDPEICWIGPRKHHLVQHQTLELPEPGGGSRSLPLCEVFLHCAIQPLGPAWPPLARFLKTDVMLALFQSSGPEGDFSDQLHIFTGRSEMSYLSTISSQVHTIQVQ